MNHDGHLTFGWLTANLVFAHHLLTDGAISNLHSICFDLLESLNELVIFHIYPSVTSSLFSITWFIILLYEL